MTDLSRPVTTTTVRLLIAALMLIAPGAGFALPDGDSSIEPVVLDPIRLGDTPDGDPTPTTPGGSTTPGTEVVLTPPDVVFIPPEVPTLEVPTSGTTGGPTRVAYALADKMSATKYTPMPQFAKNFSGGNVTGTRSGTGTYKMSFHNIDLFQGKGSNVQISAFGGAPANCKVVTWSPRNSYLTATVACFDPSGRPMDSRYTALVVGAFEGGGRGGYVWANQPTAAEYKPSARYAYNSSNGAVSIRRGGTGVYKLIFEGLGGRSAGGNVQVTAHGNSNNACQVESWSSGGRDFSTVVRCFAPSGRPVDNTFSALVTWPMGGRTKGGFAWAEQATKASYSPSKAYAYSSSTKSPTIQRTGTGQYTVTFPGLGGGSTTGANVQVTPYGNKAATCVVRGWSARGNDVSGRVGCYDAAGRPMDTRYSFLVTW